jgi:hypothetical protein
MTADFDALLDGAKLPEKTVPVCLRGDLAAEFEELDRQLTEAQRKQSDSLDGSGVGALLDRMEALQAEMREHTYLFRLRAMPKPKFRALIAAHPPRRGDDGELVDGDRLMGVDTETFWDALIRACLIDPVLDDEKWRRTEAALTDKQYEQLSDAAWGLNRGEVDIPFSLAASRINRVSADE